MFLVGILGYKIDEKIKLNKDFVDSIENYNSNEVSEEIRKLLKDMMTMRNMTNKLMKKVMI